MPHVRGEEDPGYVGFVGEEAGYGDYRGGVVALDHAPYVDVSLGCMSVNQSAFEAEGGKRRGNKERDIGERNGDVRRCSPHKPAIHPTQP